MNTESALERAQLEFENQKWEACLEQCARILRENPCHHAALEMQASAQLHAGQLEGALQTMQVLLQISPRDPLHRLKLAALLQMEGRCGESLIEFERVAQAFPNSMFSREAEEAIEVLDRMQIQQVLIRASEQYDFGLLLQRNLDLALEESAYHLSESGRETLRQMIWDGRSEEDFTHFAPRVH